MRRLLCFLALSACTTGTLALGRLDDATAVPDGGAEAGADAADCIPGAPVRHYAFTGTGTDVPDLAGGASARILGGAALDGSGRLALDGIDDYVDLPNGILAGLDAVTFESWLRFRGGGGYQRIFDIGTSSLGEDPLATAAYVGRSYVAATPSSGLDPSGLAALFSAPATDGEVHASTATFLGQTTFRHVVVVATATSVALYLDGVPVAQTTHASAPLSTVADVNAWLGRSNYAADPYLEADYAAFRVYGRALTACAVEATFRAGP